MQSLSSEILLRHRQFLIKQVEPDFGLLDKLNATEVLSDEDKAEISAENTVYKRNTKLLEWIQATGEYDAFIEALKKSNQAHVVNYLEKNGIVGSHLRDDWPLTNRERSILRVNQEALIELLDVQDLLSRLYSAGVFSLMQNEFICSKQTSYEKNRALLEILSRRSIKDFKKTIRCLHESNQGHVAEILENGGVVVRIHAELLDDRTDEEIISGIKGLLINRSSEDSRRILEEVFNVIAVKRGESIVLYIYCRTLAELLNLQEMHVSGKLKVTLQKLFVDVLALLSIQSSDVTLKKDVMESLLSEILQRSQIEEMTVKVHEEEYKECKLYSGDVVRAVYDFDSKEIDWNDSDRRHDFFDFVSHIPREITGSKSRIENYLGFKKGDRMKIIQQGYLGDKERWWIARHLNNGQLGYIPRDRVIIDYDGTETIQEELLISESFSRMPTMDDLLPEMIDIILIKSYLQLTLMQDVKDKETVERLSSVKFSWFQRMRNRKFTANIWRQLKAMYSESDRRYASVYKSYIEENLRLTSITKRLRSNDCIKDVEGLLLTRNTGPISETKAEPRKGNNVPDLLSIIKSWGESRRIKFVKCLLQTNQKFIAQVLDHGGVVVKTEIRETRVEMMIRQLKKYDIEILKYIQEGDTTVWMWIRSKDGFLELQKPSKIHVGLSGIWNAFRCPDEAESSILVNIDSSQLMQEVETYPYNFQLCSRIVLNEGTDVRGVTKLRGKIYVLCETFPHITIILVFDDGDQFRLRKNFNIPECNQLVYISSNYKDNCLCVTEVSRVWKIKLGTADENPEVIEWLDIEDSDLTIDGIRSSKDKILLLVSPGCAPYSVNIYDLDATLHDSIPLLEDFTSVTQFAETSTGNLIFVNLWRNTKEDETEEEQENEEDDEIWILSEMHRDRQTIVSRFVPENETQRIIKVEDISVDSYDHVFLIDYYESRVILFDSDLTWNRTIIPTKYEENRSTETVHSTPRLRRLHYDGEKKQLIGCGLSGDLHIYQSGVRLNSCLYPDRN